MLAEGDLVEQAAVAVVVAGADFLTGGQDADLLDGGAGDDYCDGGLLDEITLCEHGS